MPRSLHIRHALLWNADTPPQPDFVRRDLFVGERVTTRAQDAQAIDLDGYTIFPGLINAHDHLELNHYPRTKFRERYDNAHQWGEDVNARLDESPFRELRAYPLDDRLFIGGLKNLLCGATTVGHHNPPHKALFRRDFPVRVVQRYGWAHSLHFSSEAEIQASYAATPPDAPWMIHLAEGTDATAQGEYRRLKALGCVGPNTVFIHGVGLSVGDVTNPSSPSPFSHASGEKGSLDSYQAALVWCPTTNLYLLGQTVSDELLKQQQQTAYMPSLRKQDAHTSTVQQVRSILLGSDSRLTADGDLLDEMRAASAYVSGACVVAMVGERAASALRLDDAGYLRPSAYGDFIAIHSTDGDGAALCATRRADLALVVRSGVPQIGDVAVMAKFADVPTVPVLLDGREKAIHRALAERLVKCSLQEPGLTVDVDALKPRRFFWRA